VWKLQEICDRSEDAERFADPLVQSTHAEAAAYDVEAARAIGWDEAIVVPHTDRASVLDSLPDNRVAPISARFMRPGYVEVT